ncbi:hypothetical protein HHK36_014816 [Tetracentron sinense]|uniref:Gnk2-homologous domain-containing protein n=1 Tax=Tetracentron sinense TaxID=13715 RepID=A0A834Z537_TETSI|nr:hypothetical protein HHK36_014816 [Tetracentron sinense]
MSREAPSLISLFAFLLTLSSLSTPLLSSTDSYVFAGCSQLKYAPGSPYESKLNSLLTSLVNSATYSSFNNFTVFGSTPQDVVYGLYQCRGDLSMPDCSSCVSRSVSQLGVLCSDSCGGALQLEGCFVKYDNISFVGAEDKTVVVKKCGAPVGFDSDAMGRRDAVLEELASGSGPYRVSGAGEVQGAAQCVGDLSGSECQDCVSEAIGHLRTDCGTAVSGDLFLAKCYARYSAAGAGYHYKDGGNNNPLFNGIFNHIYYIAQISSMIIAKLTEKNYLAWKDQILLMNENVDLFNHIDEKVKEPKQLITSYGTEATNPAYVQWRRDDKLLRSLIFGTLIEKACPIEPEEPYDRATHSSTKSDAEPFAAPAPVLPEHAPTIQPAHQVADGSTNSDVEPLAAPAPILLSRAPTDQAAHTLFSLVPTDQVAHDSTDYGVESIATSSDTTLPPTASAIDQVQTNPNHLLGRPPTSRLEQYPAPNSSVVPLSGSLNGRNLIIDIGPLMTLPSSPSSSPSISQDLDHRMTPSTANLKLVLCFMGICDSHRGAEFLRAELKE